MGVLVAEPVSEMERLIRKFRQPLIAFFSRRVSSVAEAEDMTQEVFLRLMDVPIGSDDTIGAYIFKIAANLVTDRRRSGGIRQAFAEALSVEIGPSVDTFDPFRIASAREAVGLLWASIQLLPEPTRQMFILYAVENIQKQNIAESFGVHHRTVEKHISKAIVLLSRKIERHP